MVFSAIVSFIFVYVSGTELRKDWQHSRNGTVLQLFLQRKSKFTFFFVPLFLPRMTTKRTVARRMTQAASYPKTSSRVPGLRPRLTEANCRTANMFVFLRHRCWGFLFERVVVRPEPFATSSGRRPTSSAIAPLERSGCGFRSTHKWRIEMYPWFRFGYITHQSYLNAALNQKVHFYKWRAFI